MIMKGLDLKLANEIRLKLIECAAQSKIICYSDLVPNVLCDNRHMNHLSKILTYISEVEWEDRKLLLSSLVVQKDTKTRSHTDGFQRNNAKCLDEKGISRFVPHSSI